MPTFEPEATDNIDPFDTKAVQAAAQRRLQAMQGGGQGASSSDKWGNAYSESIPMAETGAMTGLKFGGPVGAVVGGIIGGGVGAYRGYKSAEKGDASKFKQLAGVNAGNMAIADQFKNAKKAKKPPEEDADVETSDMMGSNAGSDLGEGSESMMA